MGPKEVSAYNGKRVYNRNTIELKKEIVLKYEQGARVKDLVSQFNLPRTTINSLLKKKEEIKSANVAKGVKSLSKQRPQVLEEVEKLLFDWIKERQTSGDGLTEAIICTKARALHKDLVKQFPGSSGEFQASRGWFNRFKKRIGIHSTDSNKTAQKFVTEFQQLINKNGFLPNQIFNCNKTGLFWKKMPKRTDIAELEKKLPSHTALKDRLTLLLCANASGDLKLKPLLVYHSETPRAFIKYKVVKNSLNVMWRSNKKALLTKHIFREWICEVFGPSVQKYLEENNIPLKALLVLGNAPAHPKELEDEIEKHFPWIQVQFLPPNSISMLQPMGQEVISNFKKLYTKALLNKRFEVPNDTSLTLTQFRKENFHILNCVRIIDKAWAHISRKTLRAAWRKLWPDGAPCKDFEDFNDPSSPEPEDEALPLLEPDVEEIVVVPRILGLEVNADVGEKLQDHRVELITEELQESHKEQHRILDDEFSEEEEQREKKLSTSDIEQFLFHWSKVKDFLEENELDKESIRHLVNIFEDGAVRLYREHLKERQYLSTSGRFLLKEENQPGPSTE